MPTQKMAHRTTTKILLRFHIARLPLIQEAPSISQHLKKRAKKKQGRKMCVCVYLFLQMHISKTAHIAHKRMRNRATSK